MRKETSNQFTEGLISDLNPINTPNNVLTDALNATIITYNGNEYNLQNDRGNYELEYCRLKPNYIPVGIKEYGDILYIVSYNPLDKNVEIGSYPSPLMVSKPMEPDLMDNDCSSIIKTQILDKGLTEGNYTNLMENADSIVFNGEDYKLNPGDEYCLQVEGESFPYKYETVEFHILDEDSNIHNINDKIKIDQNGGDKDFQHVAWTIPGWLAIKARLAELSTAGINIKSFYTPKTEDEQKSAYFSFDLRLNIKDEFLTENIITDANGNHTTIMQEWCKAINNGSLPDVKFRVFIERKQGSEFKSIYNQPYVEFSITDNSNTPDNFYLSNYDWSEWFGSSRMLWKSIYGRIDNLDSSDIIKVSMVPILCENEHNYKIVYDNLRQELLFDLGNIEDDKWNIGSNLYQFYTSADGKSQYIYTDISGPKISSFPVDLQCDIYNIDGDVVISNYKFSDYSGIGENLLQIPFNDSFKKEDIYVIKFKFAKDVVEEDLFPTVSRFLITSEVFNDFSNKEVYDRDILFNEWINNYIHRCKLTTDISISDTGLMSEIFNWETSFTEADKRYQEGKKYNTFFPEYDSGLSEEWIYRKGFTDTYNIKNNSSIDFLHGPIWDKLNPVIDYKYKDASSIDFEDLTDTVKINRYIETVLKQSKENSFLFADTNEKNFDVDLIDYIGEEEVQKILNKTEFKDIGKISDYRIDIKIYIIGRKNDGSDEQSKKEARCSVRLLKNGQPINNTWYKNGLLEIEGILKRILMDEDWRESLTWTNSDGELYWRVGTTGIIEPCILPRLFIGWVLRELQLPFVWISTNYILRKSSANWTLNTGVIGGENIPEFCFYNSENKSFIHDYIAFHRRITEYDYEGKDFVQEQESDGTIVNVDIKWSDLANWNPVLIPLTTKVMGTEYFKYFCKNFNYVKENVSLEDTSVYKYTQDSSNNIDAIIDVYYRTVFDSDFLNKQKRLSILQNLENKNIFVKNVEILSGEYIESEYEKIYTEKLKLAEFEDTNSWPYKDSDKFIGIDTLSKNISKWFGSAKNDVDYWLSSPVYKKLQEGGNVAGVYIPYDVAKTQLLTSLSDALVKTKKISLYAKNFDAKAPGDTEDILYDLSPSGWQIALSSLGLVSALTVLGIFEVALIGSTSVIIGNNQNKQETNILVRLSHTGCATLDTWNNISITDGEARVHIMHGTIWGDDPQFILDKDWSWVTGV